MKIQITLLVTTSLLIGCSSTPKSPQTVRTVVEHAPSTVITQSASYSANTDPKQAAIVCENYDMKTRVLDDDPSNDVVRLMVVQDSTLGSNLLSEVEVDCRDYYLKKTLGSSSSNLVSASTEPVVVEPAERTVRRSTRLENNGAFTYIVQRGDTVWGIAREHCTSVKAISRLNGLGRGNIIDIGQRLKMPDEEC